MNLNTKIYRLTWQHAGFPEHSVTGDYESISYVRGLLKDRGGSSLGLRVEATSARLPAPEPELIETVDLGVRTRQGGHHAASQTAEPDSGE